MVWLGSHVVDIQRSVTPSNGVHSSHQTLSLLRPRPTKRANFAAVVLSNCWQPTPRNRTPKTSMVAFTRRSVGNQMPSLVEGALSSSDESHSGLTELQNIYGCS